MSIDLKLFCGESFSWKGCKYSIPFVKDGFKYAINYMLCVRIPCDEPNTDCKFPDLSFFPDKNIDDNLFEYIDLASNAKEIKGVTSCDVCEGAGYHQTECEDCYGDGWVECPTCGNEMDCEFCDGQGTVDKEECEICKGVGGIDGIICYQVLSSHILKSEYDKMITLPNIVCRIYDNKSYYFKFDGGDGMVSKYHYAGEKK